MNPEDPFRPSYRGVPPGTRLNGIYEIDQMIGAGGMGEVYKCHEIQTGAAVAIKMLLPDMAENEAALALFRREAAALHHLPHDAIVRYFVFYGRAGSAAAIPGHGIRRRPVAVGYAGGDGPLTFEALVKLMRRIASGLQAAHERGIIHRDVSPDNIIVPLSDVTRAKIIDFGIARSTQIGDKTIIGSGFAGKDNYVSPEQVGLYGGEVTAKSDIYSLGLLLFYALTGQKLDMGGSQFQLVEKRRRVPDLGGVDMRIRPLLEQMLQPDPANRPCDNGGDRELADRVVAPAGLRSTAARRALRSRRNLACRNVIARSQTAALSGWSSPPLFSAALVGGGGLCVLRFGLVGTRCRQAAAAAGIRPEIPGRACLRRKHRPALPAARPTAAPPSAGDAAARADRVRRYVEQYNGGDCFFMLPVALSSNAAVIEGFGASTAPFDALDKAFRRDLGFEASIGVRLVTQAQCPAIKFLGQLGGNQARAPRINLGSVEVRNGETLSGTIENFANRVVELLLVSDGGEVQNLSYLLKPGTDSLSFSLGIRRSRGGEGPQLVMAVTTPQVLDLLRQPNPMAADTFFLQAISEAQRTNMTIATAARYFRLKN